MYPDHYWTFKNNLQDFHNALVNLDIKYFYKLRNRDLFNAIEIDFIRDSRINRAHIAEAYNDLFGEKLSPDAIMKQLRAMSTEDIFEVENIKHSGSNWYILEEKMDDMFDKKYEQAVLNGYCL